MVRLRGRDTNTCTVKPVLALIAADIESVKAQVSSSVIISLATAEICTLQSLLIKQELVSRLCHACDTMDKTSLTRTPLPGTKDKCPLTAGGRDERLKKHNTTGMAIIPTDPCFRLVHVKFLLTHPKM